MLQFILEGLRDVQQQLRAQGLELLVFLEGVTLVTEVLTQVTPPEAGQQLQQQAMQAGPKSVPDDMDTEEPSALAEAAVGTVPAPSEPATAAAASVGHSNTAAAADGCHPR